MVSQKRLTDEGYTRLARNEIDMAGLLARQMRHMHCSEAYVHMHIEPGPSLTEKKPVRHKRPLKAGKMKSHVDASTWLGVSLSGGLAGGLPD